MRKYVITILGFLGLAFVTQWLAIKYIPNLVYKIAVHRAGNMPNKWIHNGKTDAKMRSVVLPNPDFIYSALFYDVNKGDLQISGVLPDSTYASIAFYDNRCQPYYVYNNLSPDKTGQFTLQLSKVSGAGVHHIQAKTENGVVICRFLLSGDSSFQRMSAFQHQLSIEKK